MVSPGHPCWGRRARGCTSPLPGRLQKLGQRKAQGVVQQESRLRPVDAYYGSAWGRMEELSEVGGAAFSGLLKPFLAFCGNFGPGGWAGAQELEGGCEEALDPSR